MKPYARMSVVFALHLQPDLPALQEDRANGHGVVICKATEVPTTLPSTPLHMTLLTSHRSVLTRETSHQAAIRVRDDIFRVLRRAAKPAAESHVVITLTLVLEGPSFFLFLRIDRRFRPCCTRNRGWV